MLPWTEPQLRVLLIESIVAQWRDERFATEIAALRIEEALAGLMQVKPESKEKIMPDETTPVDWSTLVGKFFHELGEDGKVDRQGIIRGEPYPYIFVVTYLEWITGGPSFGERLITLDNILQGKWQFYPTVEEMRDAYEHSGIARRS